MDILLLNAPAKRTSKHARLTPPLGLAYIASVLLGAGYDVSAIDLNVGGLDPLVLEKILKEGSPRIVGVSAHTETYLNGLKIAEIAKQVNPEIATVMGGTHPTVMHEEAARDRNIDVVVRGEGECTMLELADCLIKGKSNLAEVKGIAYREDGVVRSTPERPFIKNPDELPFPARELFPITSYETPGQVLISRGGCPFNCRFCAVNNVWKGSRRFRNPENVAREIFYMLGNFQLDEISFGDDTFTLNRERVIALCDQFKEIGEIFPWRWKCGTRVDLVDKELLEKMYEAGCYNIQFGVEAGSQQILDSIGKKIRLEQVRKAVSMTLNIGMGAACFFMFPHPEDTEETIREQKQLMKELAEMGAGESLAATTPYPGTYYYEHADELGIKILAKSWDEYDAKHLVITTKYLSKEKLESLLEELVQGVGLKLIT